jgi:hypothetical protein
MTKSKLGKSLLERKGPEVQDELDAENRYQKALNEAADAAAEIAADENRAEDKRVAAGVAAKVLRFFGLDG